MAAEELARPGVEVIQEFRTVTPSIITPTLVPCVVGVAKQIVEVLADDASGGSQLNPDALIVLPAFFISAAAVGSPLRYSGLNGLSLVLSVNESVDFTITFSDPTSFGLPPASVVDQVNKSLRAQLITSCIAETVGDDRWQLRTLGVGEFQSIVVAPGTSPAVLNAFDLGIGRTYRGLTAYNQYDVEVPPTAFPDPNGNLEELSVQLDTVRVFLFTGSGVGLQESLRTSSFLLRGEVAIAAATDEGTVDLSGTFPFFAGEVLWLQLETGGVQVVSIPASVNTPAQLLTLLNGTSGFTGVVASLGLANSGLVFTRTVGGYAYTVQLLSPDTNSALGLLGLSAQTRRGVSVSAIDDGNGDAVTPLLAFTGFDFTASPGSASLLAAAVPNLPPPADSTLVISDGGQPQTVVFDGTETLLADVIAAISAVVGPSAGGKLVATDSAGRLLLTNSDTGEESYIEILGGTALPSLDPGSSFAATLEGTQSLSPDTPAVTAEGTVNLEDGAGFPTLGTQTFTIALNGGGPVTVTLASEANFAALKLNIETALPTVTATRASGSSGGLVLTGTTTGAAASIAIGAGTGGAALLGLAIATVNGVDVFPTIGTESFQVDVDEAGPVLLTLASQTAFGTLKTYIEGVLTGVTATQGLNGGLVLTGSTPGNTGSIEIIDNGGGGVALLGLTAGTYVGGGEVIGAGAKAFGAPYKALPGDELWLDGVFYATITKVAPGALTNVVRIDRQVPISTNVGRYFYVVAKNLTVGSPLIGVSRPTQDLQVSLEGNIKVKHNQLRDITGAPITGKAPLYLSYTAVRQDVSPLAANPGLLRFDSTLSLEQQLAPLTTDNPLALGLFFALLNAPGIEVTGLGVDAVSADAPFGTVEAFTRAAEYLESFEVYAIAPLTHDKTVAEVFNTHVSFMSGPTQKGERIVLWNPVVPTNALDKLVASNTNGDALTGITFDTKVVNLSTLLNNAGVDPVGIIPVTKGVFLDILGDDLNYSVESISGGVVTLRTVFDAGTNDDGFFSTTPLTLPIIAETFAIRVRGQALVKTDGTPDKPAIAATVSGLGQSFQNRRFWMTFPDRAAATLSGLEQVIDGFYLNAGIVGMIGQQPPQQSFTNFPMTGYTRVLGSNDTFSSSQLDAMAGGGAYIIVQDTPGGPLTARMALTTDLTSIETRTDSITKVVDFTAKFMRRGLRNFIGRFNITQGFLDTLGSVIQGLGGFLVETGVLIGLTLNSIVQDEDARDTVLVDTTLDPPYPCNYIRLTLVV